MKGGGAKAGEASRAAQPRRVEVRCDGTARFATSRDDARVARAVVSRALAEIRSHQPVFALTGGCHAASIVRFDGEHVCTFEDVGRHNAVDKAIGACVLARRLPLAAHLLVVSGRTSFEIIQKALAAGISAVASVSAPSSLAICRTRLRLVA